ncbi:MAG: DUF5011 domain-containing protein [Anaerorhabdus sp.]|uniref:immunoglobulin-like domain-containing protein n=1 Tax=Anaerorhabdus sp. TaxID=1872524 RepID=UPI002FCC0D44
MIHRLLKSLLSIILTLAMIDFPIDAQEPDIQVSSNITYSEDKQEAIIELTVMPNTESDVQAINYQNENIMTNSDGVKSAKVQTFENGDVEFEIVYIKNEETLIQTETIKVDGLIVTMPTPEVTDEPTSIPENLESSLAGISSTGAVAIEVVGYDSLIGLTAATPATSPVVEVKVKVDFPDTLNENKILTVNVPIGMCFNSIPVVEGKYNTLNVDSKLLVNIDSTSTLYQAIEEMIVPQMDLAIAKQTYGNLIYKFKADTQSIEVTFKIQGDYTLFYGNTELLNAVEAKATAGIDNEIVAESSYAIKLVEISGYPYSYRVYGGTGTVQAIPSTPTEIIYGRTNPYFPVDYANSRSPFKPKDPVVTLYYPEGMIFDSVLRNGNLYTGNARVEDVPAEHKVNLYFSGYVTIPDPLSVQYIVPEGMEFKKYSNQYHSYITYTTYDGKLLRTANDPRNNIYGVTIIDPNTIANKAVISAGAAMKTFDSTIPDGNYYAGAFSVSNTSGRPLENQTVEYIIDPNWQVTQVKVPFDAVGDANINAVSYQTNLHPYWRTYNRQNIDDFPTINYVSTTSKLIRGSILGLSEGEYITGLKCNIGTLRQDYGIGLLYSKSGITTYGNLKNGVPKATVTIKMYDENNMANTLVTATSEILALGSTPQSIVGLAGDTTITGSTGVVSNMLAGKSYHFQTTLGIQEYQYLSTTFMRSPIIYLRVPEGIQINLSSLKLFDESGNEVSWTDHQIKDNRGNTVQVINTQSDFVIGNYFYTNATMKKLKVDFDFNVLINANANAEINFNQFFYWTGMDQYNSTGGYTGMRQDIFDVNGNGDTTEYLQTLNQGVNNNVTYPVTSNNNVLVESFIAVEGKQPSGAYDPSNPDTIAYFTPETKANYTLFLTNNTNEVADEFIAYFPIPKTGINFGANFQNQTFQWDMKLAEVITNRFGNEDNFVIEYSVDARDENYANATYTANTADLSKVTMVRVTATKPIPSQSIATFNVHLQIDETLQSAQVDNKIGKMNEYNPYYYVKSSTFQGSLKGTPIGTQLVIGEIKGLTFLDLDANGTFDGLDVALPNQRISLWKYNDTNSNYEEVLDESGNQLIIQSDTNGIYEFSDTQGVTTGVYAIKFELENGYRFTPSLGGSNENLSQVGYVGLNEGWIKGIDPTIPSSQSLNSGYVKYNINDITLVHPSTSAIKLNKLYSETAQFSYLSMSRLLSKTDAYEWELVNPADSNYVTLLSNKTNTMTLIGEKITQTPVYIKLTIHDIYGDTRTFDPIEISVLGNSAPILELNNNEINVSVGASLDTSAAAMLKPIIDDYDTLSYSDVRVTSNLNLNKVGYYKVTYAVTDSDGNTSSVDLIVKVHGLPYLVDKDGLPVDLSNLPLRKRSNEEALYFSGLHPVYEKVINETTTNPFESIPLGNVANQGVAVVTGIKDKFDNIFAPSQDILKVGVYEISYYLENPYGGVSELKRELRVRGNISVRDGSLDYSSTSAVKNYSSLKEFLDANTINGLYAAVEILGLNDITEIKDLVPDDITYVGSIPFNEIDFTELPQGQTSNTIMIPCEVTDSQSGYSTKTKAINIFVHVFDNSANAPVITIDYPITYRLTTDPILMLDGNTEVLPSGGSDFKASDIYKKLMEYVKVEPDVTVDIEKIDVMTTNTSIDLSNANAESQVIDALTHRGIIEVTYVAEDIDRNVSHEIKTFEVATPIEFVNNQQGQQAFIPVIELRQTDGGLYNPSVYAKYTEANGDEVVYPVYADEISLDNAGAQFVLFSTPQTYEYLPDSLELRANATVQQTLRVQGAIWISDDGIYDYFVDQKVDLNQVTAGFEYVNNSNNLEERSLIITYEYPSSVIEVKDYSIVEVQFSAVDRISGAPDNEGTYSKKYNFITKPEINTAAEITVKENETEANMEKLMDISASVTLGDGTSADAGYVVDFTNVDPIKGGEAVIRATYTLKSGESRTTEQTVNVIVIPKPIITVESYTLFVGQNLDLISNSKLEIKTNDGVTADVANAKFTQTIPVDGTVVKERGIYDVTVSYEDTVGNVSTAVFEVRVNEQPIIRYNAVNQVQLNTSLSSLLQALDVNVSYIDYAGQTIELNKNDIQVDAKDYNPKQEGEYTIGFSYEFTPLNKMITASAVVYVVNQNPPTPTPGPTSVPSPLPPNNEVVTPPINQETTNGSLVGGNGKPIQPTTTPEIIEDVVVGGFEIKLYRKQNFPKKVKDENYWWVIIVVIIAGIIIYILIKKDDKK